jgi:hypothetical protein
MLAFIRRHALAVAILAGGCAGLAVGLIELLGGKADGDEG